ncbi:MAG: hypothetical protein NT166_14735 [Candidatus Aminicenantes bacterium]|nr:hypothetical protein [Candidatus Aminicenantes bacterium]
MGTTEDFSLLLSDFNKVQEGVFLDNINNFAGNNKDAVIKTFSLLLKSENVNIQLKYLVLKSMGELKYREFIPMIRQLLDRGDKVRIIQAAIDCLVRINTMEAYKTVALFLRENPGTDFKMQVEDGLKELLNKNRLLYHFDVFYRDRGGGGGGDIKGVEKSGEFLVKHLPEIYVKDILPALSSKFYDIRYGALQILENRPNPLYYMPIYNHFKAHAQSTSASADEKFFLVLSRALVTNAALSKLSGQIFLTLKERLQELEGNKRLIFAIMLLKLDTPAMIAEIIEIYPRLDYIGKRQVFQNLDRRDTGCYLDFLRRLLKEETNDDLSARIMEILISAQDFEYIFQVIKDEPVRRKEMLLEILLQYDPPDLQEHLKECIQSSHGDRSLHLSLEYLLRHAADDYFAFIKSIFFSGVPNGIKTLIIRNIAKFSSYNRKVFMESVFKDIKVIDHFKKDFLFSLLGLLNEKKLDKEFEDMLLNRVLVMMEESRIEDIIHFIYFFDRYEVSNIKDLGLIIEELRLLQDMILKSGRKDDLVRSIHVLIKSIEKRARLKGLPVR